MLEQRSLLTDRGQENSGKKVCLAQKAHAPQHHAEAEDVDFLIDPHPKDELRRSITDCVQLTGTVSSRGVPERSNTNDRDVLHMAAVIGTGAGVSVTVKRVVSNSAALVTRPLTGAGGLVPGAGVRSRHRCGQAHIGNFSDALPGKQDVAGLQIPVKTVQQCAADLYRATSAPTLSCQRSAAEEVHAARVAEGRLDSTSIPSFF